MFLNGLTLPIERLYPKIEFPVSRGTPMISPIVKWDHTEDWYVMTFAIQKGAHSGERKVTLSMDEDGYIAGHVIDGKCIHSCSVMLMKNPCNHRIFNKCHFCTD